MKNLVSGISRNIIAGIAFFALGFFLLLGGIAITEIGVPIKAKTLFVPADGTDIEVLESSIKAADSRFIGFESTGEGVSCQVVLDDGEHGLNAYGISQNIVSEFYSDYIVRGTVPSYHDDGVADVLIGGEVFGEVALGAPLELTLRNENGDELKINAEVCGVIATPIFPPQFNGVSAKDVYSTQKGVIIIPDFIIASILEVDNQNLLVITENDVSLNQSARVVLAENGAMSSSFFTNTSQIGDLNLWLFLKNTFTVAIYLCAVVICAVPFLILKASKSDVKSSAAANGIGLLLYGAVVFLSGIAYTKIFADYLFVKNIIAGIWPLGCLMLVLLAAEGVWEIISAVKKAKLQEVEYEEI